jgi:hypothetical protein
MIQVSNELKNAFNSASAKRLVLVFDDGTIIDNSNIALESMELEQTLSNDNELKFGSISAACFKVQIRFTSKSYKGMWFNASLWCEDYEMPLGRFCVYSDNATSNRAYRDVVAYDKLYWVINQDVSEWYNGLSFPISIREMRNSLFDYLGIEQVVAELPTDSIMVEKTLDGNGLTGQEVIKAICEISACFGCINNNGAFRYVQFKTKNNSLYPTEILYPINQLIPNPPYDDTVPKSKYQLGSLNYEEYETQTIEKVTIREDAEDSGYSVGSEGNTYVIQSNFLMHGASDETLKTVGVSFLNKVKSFSYTPASLKSKGTLWREVGDVLEVVAQDKTMSVPILNRVLSGIQALKDDYSAKGTETYGESSNVGIMAEINKTKSRTNKLTRTLDETRSEITKIEAGMDKMQSSIVQTAEKVESKVSKGEISSTISQEADKIAISGDRISISSENFTLTEDGEILAQKGTVGSWEITNKYLQGTASDGSYVRLYPHLVQWIGANDTYSKAITWTELLDRINSL